MPARSRVGRTSAFAGGLVLARLIHCLVGPESSAMTFDYGAPAELFMAKRKGGSRQPLGYRRFATAAEAIRFAIEDFPTMRTLGAWMQVGDERFDGDAIQRLYDSSNYPLQRRPPTGD
jgi:hypothetical protein